MSAIDTVRPYTMLPAPRLEALIVLVRAAPAEGAIVQCGVGNGGSAALLAYTARPRRDAWLFDSFEGLPAPGPEDGAKAHRKHAARPDWCRGSEEKVREVFAAVHFPPSRLHIVSGWLAETLAVAETGPIAVLHIDVDFYAATRAVLSVFASRVVPGGLIVCDDYGHWQGARRACDELLPPDGHDLLPGDPTRYWIVEGAT